MTPKDVIKIPTMQAFYELRERLNLTDRQRIIFYLKYSRGMRNIDIAYELTPPVNQDTVGEDLRTIRQKLAAIVEENVDKQNDEGSS